MRFLAMWLLLFGVAFVNGALREVGYGPYAGAWAQPLSVLLGILLFGWVIGALQKKWPFASVRQAGEVGLFWALLTEVTELVVVIGVSNKGWDAFLKMHNLFAGELWLIFLAWIAFAPALLHRWFHPSPPEQETLSPGGKRLLVFVYVLIAIHGLLLFVSAWNFQWERGWLFLSLEVTFFSIELWLIAWVNPASLNGRAAARKEKGTEPFDPVILRVHVVLMLALFVVAGLDAGQGWSQVPSALSALGVLSLLIGAFISAWALFANTFFEPTVRIQTNRNHHVIQDGPYAYVRHPGYLGMFFLVGSYGLVLGSWFAVGVGVLVILNFINRTRLEDNVLHEKLDGYKEYARQTRYRLFPGIW